MQSVQKKFNAVKVFSATMATQRNELGDVLTRWLASAPDVEVVETVVTQSSDSSFHMLALTVFYNDSRQAQPAGSSARRLSFKEDRR